MDKPLRQYRKLLRPIKIGTPACIEREMPVRQGILGTTEPTAFLPVSLFTERVLDYVDRLNDGSPVFETTDAVYVPNP